MFANVDALHNEILAKDPRSFVSHYIFEPVPFAFSDNLSMWIEWKSLLSHLIDVDSRDIVLTGSAAIGFSLNPNKNFKAFDHNSDFDCGIISSHYFDLAWRYLRQAQVSWLTLPGKVKQAIKSHRQNHVFAGTIAADQMLGILPFGLDWQNALDRMRQADPTRGREVNLRIYKDFDALRSYQSYGLEKLKSQIGEQADSEAIGFDQ